MLGKKGDFWHLGGRAWPLCPAPKSAYELGYPPLSLFSFLLPFLFFLVLLHFTLSFLFSLPFSLLSFSFLHFLSLRLEVRPLESSYRVWGALAPSVGSAAEPQSKSNLVDFNL